MGGDCVQGEHDPEGVAARQRDRTGADSRASRPRWRAPLLVSVFTVLLLTAGLPVGSPQTGPASETGVPAPPVGVLHEGGSASHYFDTNTEHALAILPAAFTYRGHLSFLPEDAVVRFEVAGEATVQSGGSASVDFWNPGSSYAKTWMTVDVLEASGPVVYRVWVETIPHEMTEPPTPTPRWDLQAPPMLDRMTPVQGVEEAPAMAPELPEGRSWLTHAHTGHTEISTSACGPDGLLELDLEIPHHARQLVQDEQACLETSQVLDVTRPGVLDLTATAIETYAATTVAKHTLDLIPYDTSTVEGYPDLASMDLSADAQIVSVLVLVADEGSVRSYDVTVDGKTVLSRWTDPPEEGDFFSTVTFNQGFGDAWYRIDGELVWTGLIHQTGDAWWHIQPVDGPVSSSVLGVS